MLLLPLHINSSMLLADTDHPTLRLCYYIGVVFAVLAAVAG